MPISARVFRQALLKKGFRLERKTADYIYYLWVGGRRTSVFTKVSMGRGEDIGEVLISRIKGQMRLDKPQLVSFVDCPMGEAEYLEILRKKEVIE